MKPTPVNLPTVADLVTLTLRFVAAQFCVALLLAIPVAVVWVAVGVMGR